MTTREEKYDIVAKHLSTQEKTHRGKYAYNEWLTEYTGLKKSEEKNTRQHRRIRGGCASVLNAGRAGSWPQ